MVRRLLFDLRIAVRSLIKQPRYTIVASLTLALGIGAVSAIFSVVNAVLLQPLRYPNASRLVNIWSTAPGLGYDQFPLSPDLFKFYKDHNGVFEDMALHQRRRTNLGHVEGPEVVDSSVTTAGYFSTLGATFALGRPYTPEEDTPQGSRVVVLSHRLWQRAYGGNPGVLGQVARLDGEPTEIVGVAPAWLDRTGSPDLWQPVRFPPDQFPAGNFGWNAIARLKPGVSPEDAATHLHPLVTRAMESITSENYRAFLTNGAYRPLVHFMKEDIVGEAEEPLWILFGTVGIVLLIACANVANLCLIRAEARQREIGVRLALGGSRSQLVRSMMTEALVLSAIGAAAGVLVAALALPALIRLAPTTIPRLEEVRVNGLVLLVAAGLAVISAAIFGLVPAVRYTRDQVLGALRHGGRGATDHPSRHRGRSILVATQTALAMILLVGSGLLARSFARMMDVEPGFDAEGVMTVGVALPAKSYPERSDVVRVSRQIVERLSQLAGADGAGATTNLPLASSSSGTAFEIEGRPLEPGKLPPLIQYQVVTPGYFSTMRARVTRGRDVEWRDTTNIVVNASAAAQHWPGQDPIGKRLRRAQSQPTEPPPWHTVVGIVGDIRQDGLTEPAPAHFYFPPDSTIDEPPRALTYIIRGHAAAVQAEPIRQAVRAIDADLPIATMRTMAEVVDRSVVQFSFTMLTLGIAAGVALLLGAIGLYSVLSYAVSLETREIGVRLALGAPPSRVMRAVVARGVAICAVGVVVGSLGALGVTRLLGGLLFQTAPLDPLTFVATAVALLAVALAASYLPARRAARLEPLIALRNE